MFCGEPSQMMDNRVSILQLLRTSIRHRSSGGSL
jgi:hypothetical protein